MSGTWWQSLTGLDFEATGVDVWNDRIVTAAVVDVQPGQRPVTHRWIIDPGVEIPKQASDIHGWTTDRIRSHPGRHEPQAALFEIGTQLGMALRRGTPLVAFNAPYDLTLYAAECRRHGLPTLGQRMGGTTPGPIIDPLVIDKQMSRRKGSRRLADQVAHYGVILAGAHDAACDALAAVRLVPQIIAKHAGRLGDLSAAELHDLQVGWRSEQHVSFYEYRRKSDPQAKATDFPPDWPIIRQRPRQATEVA